MTVTDPVLNAAADAAAALLVWASMHTASPGGTGANEVTGGTPAYARQQVAWNAATGAVTAISGTETFNVPAGVTVAWLGLWSAATAGTFRGQAQLSASETFTAQGTYVLTALTLTASNAA